MKFKDFGSITNPKTNETKDIVVRTTTRETCIFAVIATVIVGTVTLACRAAYKAGAVDYCKAECETLQNLNLM